MNCVACGGSTAEPLYDVRGFAIVRCTCGLARTALPPNFDPASIYTEEYFQGGHHDGYADYAGSREHLRAEFRRVLDALPVRAGKLIEIGCAYGFFLDEAAERFTVTGVEISDAARAACIERGHVVMRDFDDDVVARGPFDAAVMLDVIEHLPDPGAILARVSESLRPGAPLAITTGDFGSVLARVMRKRWRLMTPPQHLWFFSHATLGALLERHGFRIERFEHPWKQVPLALVAYQASRYLGGQKLVQRLTLPGRIPVNLFDAMRVIAIRT